MSVALKTPAALAVSSVEPWVYLIPISRRAGEAAVPNGTDGNWCEYTYVPVAVPSVDPIVKSVLSPIWTVLNVETTPAITGAMSGTSTVPAAPNDAPVGAMLSGDAL